MEITHIALWVKDLELMRSFYEKYFNAVSNKKYENPVKGFSSYFLSFGSKCRLEIMKKENSGSGANANAEFTGFTHIAFSAGSEQNVNTLTNRLRNDGYTILSDPRRTGDGYYESIVLDPEGNHVEIVV